jgi:hypothetical protein
MIKKSVKSIALILLRIIGEYYDEKGKIKENSERRMSSSS